MTLRKASYCKKQTRIILKVFSLCTNTQPFLWASCYTFKAALTSLEGKVEGEGNESRAITQCLSPMGEIKQGDLNLGTAWGFLQQSSHWFITHAYFGKIKWLFLLLADEFEAWARLLYTAAKLLGLKTHLQLPLSKESPARKVQEVAHSSLTVYMPVSSTYSLPSSYSVLLC